MTKKIQATVFQCTKCPALFFFEEDCVNHELHCGDEEIYDAQPDTYTFEQFWNDYDKKRGLRSKLEAKWNKLSNSEKEAIREYIPRYKESQPDKQFRKDPASFLNQKAWHDEIITPAPKQSAFNNPQRASNTGLEGISAAIARRNGLAG